MECATHCTSAVEPGYLPPQPRFPNINHIFVHSPSLVSQVQANLASWLLDVTKALVRVHLYVIHWIFVRYFF